MPEIVPAVSVNAPAEKTNWLGDPGSTVSCCVAVVNPDAESVKVGVPAWVSSYKKLISPLPTGMVRLVIFAVSAAFQKIPAVEVLAKSSGSPPLPAVARLPEASSSCSVIALEFVPAARVCGR